MKIKKIKDTGNSKWPKKVVMRDGSIFYIPQQKNFCSFSKSHGCSLAAVSVALQLHQIRKSPTEVYIWARQHLSDYTGSKLTVYGCEKAINGISEMKIAKWYPITGTKKNLAIAIKRIRKSVRAGKIVLIETKNPIHTNVILARRNGGVWNATNGKVVKTTVTRLVKNAYHCGADQKENWWPKASGYVIVDCPDD